MGSIFKSQSSAGSRIKSNKSYQAFAKSGIGKSLSNFAESKALTFDKDWSTGEYGGPRDISTPYSRVSGGMATIDPTIRNIRMEEMGRLRGGLDTYLTQAGDLRSRFLGNESAYKQAIMNPLLQQTATRRGELQRSIGLRGMGGSSFGEQAITGFDTESQRALADARAQAEMQSLSALTGLDQSRLDAITQVAGQSTEIASQMLEQELRSLGLAEGDIARSMGVFENLMQRRFAEQQYLLKANQAVDDSARGWFGSSMAASGKGGGKGGGGGVFSL